MGCRLQNHDLSIPFDTFASFNKFYSIRSFVSLGCYNTSSLRCDEELLGCLAVYLGPTHHLVAVQATLLPKVHLPPCHYSVTASCQRCWKTGFWTETRSHLECEVSLSTVGNSTQQRSKHDDMAKRHSFGLLGFLQSTINRPPDGGHEKPEARL